MNRLIKEKVPWHKQGVESIECFEDIIFGYLIFYDDEPIPHFIEDNLSKVEKHAVYERLIIQKPSIRLHTKQ